MKKYVIISYLPDLIFWISIIANRNKKKKDFVLLRKKYILNLTGWNFTHILSYIIKGCIFKKNYIIIFFLIGFIFEFVEYFISHKTSIKYVDYNIIKDPIINTLSYIFGIYLYKIVKKVLKLPGKRALN